MVTPISLQSAPELPALDPPPVTKHIRPMWQFLEFFLHPVTLTFDFSTEKMHSTYSWPAERYHQFIIFFLRFYRAMHVVLARYCYRMSSIRLSVHLSVCLSVTLMYRGHIGRTSSKLITRIISLGSSLLGATASLIHRKYLFESGQKVTEPIRPEMEMGHLSWPMTHVTHRTVDPWPTWPWPMTHDIISSYAWD